MTVYVIAWIKATKTENKVPLQWLPQWLQAITSDVLLTCWCLAWCIQGAIDGEGGGVGGHPEPMTVTGDR